MEVSLLYADTAPADGRDYIGAITYFELGI